MRGRPSSADRLAGNAPRRPRHTAGIADGAKVRIIDRLALHTSMLSALCTGLRDGVPAQLLDGHQAYRDLHGLTVVNQRQGQTRALESSAADARNRARKARANANEESDAEVCADYQLDARRYTAEARRIEEELHRLRSKTQSTALPDTFEGEIDFLLSGLEALLDTEDGRVSDHQSAALKSVLHDFTISLEGTSVRWSASLLVPADGQVVVVGPFTGTVAARGRLLTAAEVRELPTAAGSGQRRRTIVHRLERAGFPTHLSRAASLAPGDYLVRALLGEDVTWPSCSSTFDHSAFNEHVRSVWSSNSGWSASVYCQTNSTRQALADLVAHFGGTATLAELDPHLARLGIRRGDVYAITLPKRARKETTLPWPPTVTRTNTWSARSKASGSQMACLVCPRCGKPATAVVRVPEVPDALLCRTCRVMPSNGQLEFPPLYLDLALPSQDFQSAPPRAPKHRHKDE